MNPYKQLIRRCETRLAFCRKQVTEFVRIDAKRFAQSIEYYRLRAYRYRTMIEYLRTRQEREEAAANVSPWSVVEADLSDMESYRVAVMEGAD